MEIPMRVSGGNKIRRPSHELYRSGKITQGFPGKWLTQGHSCNLVSRCLRLLVFVLAVTTKRAAASVPVSGNQANAALKTREWAG